MNKKIHFLLLTSLMLLVMVVSAVHPLVARADGATPPPPAASAAADTSAPASAATQPPAATDTSAPAAATQPPAADTSAPATQPPVAADTSASASQAPSAADTSAPSVSTSVAPADTSVPSADTSVAPASTSAASAATSAAATSVAPTDTSTLVGAVPTDTPVVVLDATGTPVPLATQAAADIIETGDPMWCPSGSLPGGLGCTATKNNVTNLIAALGLSTGPGTIYFTSSYSKNDAVFDPTISPKLSGLTDLTIQGGWNGDTGLNYALSGVTTFSVPLTITNWHFDVTLNDIVISGVTKGQTQNGTGDGLTVQTTGKIKLSNVQSNNNKGRGAYLNNTSIGSNANIRVVNSTFGNAAVSGDTTTGGNKGDGLDAYSNGQITLINVIADDNGANGVYLDSAGSSGGVDIKANNSSYNDFSFNHDDGLDVTSVGEIDLYDVVADSNVKGAGAVLNGSGKVYIDTDHHVSYNDFSSNHDDGLDVTSGGEIDLYDVMADSNKGAGAVLNGSGGVYINTDHSSHNKFNSNHDDGLDVTSGGDVTLYNVKANNNGADGALLGTSIQPIGGNIYVDTDSSNDVSGSSTFGDDSGNGNGSNGLEAYSNSSIDLESVEANWNNDQGAILNTTGLVSGASIYVDQDFTVSSHPVSSFDYNQGHGSVANPAGLQVYGDGDINIWNVDAECNGTSDCLLPSSGFPTYGMMLDNTSGGSISVDDSFFGQFDYNSGNGIEAFSNGAITLTDVVASNNSGDGAYLNNSSSPTASTITVDNSHIPGGLGFKNNGVNGLEAYAIGTITLTDVVSSNNSGGDGAFLDNCIDPGGSGLCTGSGGVIVDQGASDSSTFNNNNKNGLEVLSTGSISLDGVTADKNGEDGALLNNCYAPTDNCVGVTNNGITVTNSVFGDSTIGGNHWIGLEAYSNGLISLSDVTADLNVLGSGAALENDQGDLTHGTGTTEGITISASTFGESPTTGNGYDGLNAYSNGVISLSGVTADYNANSGAELRSAADISVDPSSFNNNGYYGLEAGSDGTVWLTDVTADSNNIGGAYLTSTGVSVVNSHFDGNGGDGLDILTIGDVSANCGSTANNNVSGYGVYGTVLGTFTNGLTLTDNGTANGVLSAAEVDTPCGGSGGGTGGSSGPAAGLGGPFIPVTGALPFNIINVPDSGDQGHGLDCTQYAGTDLVLPNGNHVLLPCPIGSTPGTSGSLKGLTSSNLPGALDSKFTLVSGLDASVTPSLTGGMVTVSFKIPAGKTGANFAILSWDGTKWVNLGGSINPPGYFSITTSLIGDFVLVTQ